MHQLDGPAPEAEMAYRRERTDLAYGRPRTTPLLARWRRWRDARRRARGRELTCRARDAADRSADAFDGTAEPTGPVTRDARTARRAAEIEAGLAALRPRPDRTRPSA